MRAQAHSAAPFAARQNGSYSWTIVDALGDRIAHVAQSPTIEDAEQEANAKLFVSAPLIADVLRRLLVEVDAEIDQRKTSGNAEDWAGLDALSVEAHAVLAAALIDEAGQ